VTRDSRNNPPRSERPQDASPAVEVGQPPAMLVADLRPGDIVSDRYKILSIVGRGAAATVYVVEQVLIKKRFALKMLVSNAASPRSKRRFQNEAQAASKLDHPNLVRAIDFGVHDNGCLFMVMDLVDGKTLGEHLKQVGRLSVEQALNIFIPICFALEYAHEQGVIHRDLKPSNIILEAHDLSGTVLVPKVVDFGIAKLIEDVDAEALTRTGEVFGTPLYMSPEQCSGDKVDRRSDIYSLGCVLYEALTGTPPFCGQSALETMMQHSTQKIPPMFEASLGTEFPEALETIIDRMLAKDPIDRYQRCFTLADHLIRLQRGEPVGALPRLVALKSDVAASLLKPKFIVVYSLLALFLILLGVQILRTPKQQSPATVATTATKSDANESPAVGLAEELKFDRPTAGSEELQLPHFDAGNASGKRIFHFGSEPKDLTFTFHSDICYRTQLPNGESKETRRLARGDVEIPPNTPILFESSVLMTMYRPYLLRSFKPDDLDGLKFNCDQLIQDKIDTGCFNVVMAYASGLKGLRKLCFCNVPLNAEGLANLKLDEMPQLISLVIEHSQVDGKDLARLPVLRRLRVLEYCDGKSIPALLTKLIPLWRATAKNESAAHELTLRRDGLSDEDLSIICNANLRTLDIRMNRDLTAAGLAHVEKLKGLQELTLSGQDFDPIFLHQLAAKMNLRDFDVDRVSWTTAQKQQLQRGLKCHVSFIDSSKPRDQ
jgi:serine/threonine protein kinase